MKTSFYFIIWIAIYPLLSLIPGAAVQNYSFMVALMVVFGISFLVQRTMMPTLRYEHALTAFGTLELLYYGNVRAIRTRLFHTAAIEFISALYFMVTTLMLFAIMFQNGGTDSIFALVIFVFLSIGALGRAIRFNKAYSAVRQNPTPETCIIQAEQVYRLDYTGYYNARLGRPMADLMPPRPRHFGIYLIVSMICAAVCTLAGAIIAVLGLIGIFFSHHPADSVISLLYGTLALYFGIKDFITTYGQLRQDKKLKQQHDINPPAE